MGSLSRGYARRAEASPPCNGLRAPGGTLDADAVIVGAGAAGLWAAAAVARAGKRVILVEKTVRAGTKILASGGTRCNLTTTLGPTEAARLFGPGEAFVTPALRALTPAAVRARFLALGVPTVEEPGLEKVFPASQRATDVRNALLEDAEFAGVALWYRTEVTGLARIEGGWRVGTSAGPVDAPAVLVCPGGQSYPRTGTTGDGYRWLRELGLTVVPPVPALVPLASDEPWVHALSGIAVQDTVARLLDPTDRVVARRARPVLFTHRGLSGPGTMDLSIHVAQRPEARWTVAIDLLPHQDLDAVRAELLAAAGRPGGPHLARVLEAGLRGREPIPARLLAAVIRQAGISADNPPLHQVERKVRNRLADALKGLRVPIAGTLGWDEAEVTGGGLALSEVDPRTLEVHRHPGLYVFGELLDLTGPIGGLNFQAAFATAELAA
ncbi:MAG: aminoacetone oxidase family FAD-binding enzyme, partial [Myxococcota bacterium]